MNNMKIKISPNKLFYWLSAVIVLTNEFNNIIINQYIRYSVAAFWTLLLFISIFRGVKTARKRNIYFNFIRYCSPYIIIALYTIIIWSFDDAVTLRNYTRLVSTLIYLALGYGFAGYGVLLFGKRAIDAMFYAGCVSYTLGSIIPVLIKYSFSDIISFLCSLVKGVNTSITDYMEVHDLTFAFGLFLIYYSFIEPENERGHKKKIILSVIMIVLGLKRIELVAIAAVFGAYYFIIRKAKTMKTRSSFLCVVFIIAVIGYVWIIYDGTLLRIATTYGIDFKHRLSYYDYAKQYYSFSPFFWGKGYTYFSKLWQTMYFAGTRIGGYGIAASLHSDVLVMFIEIGFLGCILWVYYYIKYNTMKLHGRYGILVSECYILLTMYMFLLYFTDNTSTYTITQLTYFLIPLAATESRISNFRKKYMPYEN